MNDIKKRNRREMARVNNKKSYFRLNLFFILSIIVLFTLIFMFIYQRVNIAKLRNESQKLVLEQEKMNKEIQNLMKKIEESNSLEYIEKRAREDLGMIKKDEKIYINSQENDESSKDEEKLKEETDDTSKKEEKMKEENNKLEKDENQNNDNKDKDIKENDNKDKELEQNKDKTEDKEKSN